MAPNTAYPLRSPEETSENYMNRLKGHEGGATDDSEAEQMKKLAFASMSSGTTTLVCDVDGDDDFEGLLEDTPASVEPARGSAQGKAAAKAKSGPKGKAKSKPVCAPIGGGMQCAICLETCGDVYNRGSGLYPVYRDQDCNNALARLNGAAVTPEEKEELRKLKKNKMQFRLRVLQLAKDHAGGQQRDTIQELLESLIVTSRVREECGVEMMPEDCFVTHVMNKRRCTEELAKQEWDTKSQNPDIISESVDGQVCIAVPLNKKYFTERSFELRRELRLQRTALKTEAEKTSGRKRALAMMQNSILNPMFAQDGVEPLQHALLSGQPGARLSAQDAKRKRADAAKPLNLVAGSGSSQDANSNGGGGDVPVIRDASSLTVEETTAELQHRMIERQKILVEYEELIQKMNTLRANIEKKTRTFKVDDMQDGKVLLENFRSSRTESNKL